MHNLAIIGGGLSGLTLAQLLNDNGVDFQLFEARDRFGGRVLSHTVDSNSDMRFDLGPSWIWPEEQPLVAGFIERHGLATFDQWQQGISLYQTDRELPAQGFRDPAAYAGAQRLVGGSQVLIDQLLSMLPSHLLHLQHTLCQLKDVGEHIELQFSLGNGETSQRTAQQVVVMLPPRLVAQHIEFSPALNPRLIQAMQQTPTWMAGHAKAMLQYATPFWREQGLSGSAFVNYPGCMLGEIFDSSSHDGATAALGGFFALPAALREQYRNDLEALIVEQMVRLFGAEAARPLHIHLHDWFTQSHTATPLDEIPPNAHPQYGDRVFQLDHWNDKLYFGGTETAASYGGYLEGALHSAHFIAKQIISSKGAELCQTG